MGSFRVFVALTWMVTVTIICSKAAPVTEFFGPPRTSIEGGSHVDQQPEEHEQKKVEEMERFHRTYKNGTVEFKMALSNGHVQYQRISSKIVDGDKVQVYEGYISEQYKDGRYGTRYYAADENGYRSSAVIIEDEPPKLPTSGPYSSSLSQDVQKALSPMNEDNTYTKPKTLKDNLVEIENDLEEERLINLNLGSTTESLEILKQSEEQSSSVIPSTTEFLELLSTTKLSNNYKEPEPTPLSGLEEGSGNDVPAEKPLNEDLSGSNTLPVNTSEDGEGENLNSEVRTEQSIEEIPEGTTGSLLNDEVTPTELPTQVNNEEPSTSVVPEVTEIKTDGATSSVSRYPLEDAESQSTTLSSVEATEVQTEQYSSERSEDNSTGIPTSSIASTNSNNDENTSEESVTSSEDIKLSTETSFEGVSETTTEISSNDAITSTEAPTTLSSEAHVEPSTSAIPELTDIKTETETSSVSEDAGSESTTFIPNDEVTKSSDEITEQTSSGEIASTETVTSSDLSTTESSSIETTTHLSIESSTNTEHEASVDEISNDQGSLANENNARSLDILKVLPLSEKNTTSEIKENVSENSNSSDVNEETTNTNTEQSTEEDSISSTASSSDKINSDITTEAGILLTTSENGLETDSSTEKDSQITTNQPLPSSSEENHEKSSEDETTTKLPEDSSEENQSTTSSTNLNNNSSNTEEKEGKSIEESSEENQSTPLVTEQNTEIPSTTTVEPKEEKSDEDETSTELPEESSEEGHSTKSVTSSSNDEKHETSTEDETSSTDHSQGSSEEENNTEADVISTTEEISRGVEIEFAPPVIHF